MPDSKQKPKKKPLPEQLGADAAKLSPAPPVDNTALVLGGAGLGLGAALLARPYTDEWLGIGKADRTFRPLL